MFTAVMQSYPGAAATVTKWLMLPPPGQECMQLSKYQYTMYSVLFKEKIRMACTVKGSIFSETWLMLLIIIHFEDFDKLLEVQDD